MGVLTRIKKKEKGFLTRSKKQERRESAFLKVVHPHGYVEIFFQPITAGEIMRRYPKHCVARPDFFDYPWIVVRPESVLEPGRSFFLVSHKTIDKTLREKAQLRQSLKDDEQKHSQRGTQKDQKEDRYYNSRQTNHRHEHRHHNEECCCGGRDGQDSDDGSYYKPSFYQSWNEMQRNINRLHMGSYDDQLNLELDSPLKLQRLKSCLKKADSVRRNLNLNVSFGPPVFIPSSWRASPSIRQNDPVLQV